MGYHVPKSEDVFRYLLRLDESRPEISDGFSWSILFLNDGSVEALNFLQRYGLEMCHRTADRIRFVFFSGISEQDTERVIRSIDYSRNERLITKLISSATSLFSRKKRYNWERESWANFRPSSFYPLESKEKIDVHLDFQSEIYSAMPGQEEAFKFAQRLGIGRFLPCFLFFSDLGQPDIHMFSMAGKSAEDGYAFLKYTIDTFFEINSTTLNKWKVIEDEISEILSKHNSSIQSLRQWKNRKIDLWKQLKSINYVADMFESENDIRGFLKSLEKDHNVPWQIRDKFKPFFELIEQIDQEKKAKNTIMALLKTVENEPKDFSNQLNKLSYSDKKVIPSNIIEQTEEISRLIKLIKNPKNLESTLVQWWRSDSGKPLTRGVVNIHRIAWLRYSKELNGESAKNNVGKIIKEEINFLRGRTLNQEINASPEESAKEILNEFYNYLKINDSKEDWDNNISEFRMALIGYFRQLSDSKPNWIKSASDKYTLNLKWEDCIPGWELRKNNSINACIKHMSKITEIIQTEDPITQYKNDLVSKISQFENEVEQWLKLSNSDASFMKSISDDLNYTLSIVHQQIEDNLFLGLKGISQEKMPNFNVDESGILKLTELLKEYDSSIANLRLPYKESDSVLRVDLPGSLSSVLEFKDSTSPENPSIRLEDKLKDVLQFSSDSTTIIENAKNEIIDNSPGGYLFNAIINTVSKERLSQYLLELDIKNGQSLKSKLIDKSQIVNFLNALKIQHLIAIDRHLYSDEKRDINLATDKREIKNSILSSLALSHDISNELLNNEESLSQDSIDQLQGKIKNKVFDVFLAHNSDEKENILILGKILRNNGIHPWIDVEQVPPGQWFQDILQSAISKVKSAAIIIGKSGIGKWQMVELRAFISQCVERNIPIIPVLLPQVKNIPENLIFLKELNYIKFEENIEDKTAISKLIWGIESANKSA